MIKINEDKSKITGKKDLSMFPKGKIHVTLDNNSEKTFDNYPIVIKSKDIEHLVYKIQNATKVKLHSEEKEGIVDKVFGKAKDVKDKMIDSTKEITEKTKDTSSQQQQQELKALSTEDKKNHELTNNEKENI